MSRNLQQWQRVLQGLKKNDNQPIWKVKDSIMNYFCSDYPLQEPNFLSLPERVIVFLKSTYCKIKTWQK